MNVNVTETETDGDLVKVTEVDGDLGKVTYGR